jgi:hypothetical protein
MASGSEATLAPIRETKGDREACDCGMLVLSQLHGLVLDGSSVAADRIAAILSTTLQTQFYGRFPHLDQHIVLDAVHVEILRYLSAPASYAEDGSALYWDIHLSVRRRIGHALRAEIRRRLRERQWSEIHKMNSVIADAGTPTVTSLSERKELLLQLAATEQEHRFLTLCLDGATDTQAFAEATGLTSALSPCQRQVLKRLKDRLWTRAKRRRLNGKHQAPERPP